MAATTTLTPEARIFLMGRPGIGRAHTGKLATVRADGRPHVTPIWFDLDEPTGDLVFTCSHPTVKSKNMLRDPASVSASTTRRRPTPSSRSRAPSPSPRILATYSTGPCA